MEFKDRLRSLRAEKGLTITQVADTFNKSEGAIRMWETGRAKPDVDTLIKLSDYFDVSTDYILGKCEAKRPENEATVKNLGLTDESICYLLVFMQRRIKETNNIFLIDVLNKLIPTKYFLSFLYSLGLLAYSEIDKSPDIEFKGMKFSAIDWEGLILDEAAKRMVEVLKGR